MATKSNLALATLLSIVSVYEVATSDQRPYPVEISVLDGIKSTRRSDGSTIVQHLSGALTFIQPDNTSTVLFADGTKVVEYISSTVISDRYYYETAVPGKLIVKKWVTVFPSGHKKIISGHNNDVEYYDPSHNEIPQLPDEKILYTKALNSMMDRLKDFCEG